MLVFCSFCFNIFFFVFNSKTNCWKWTVYEWVFFITIQFFILRNVFYVQTTESFCDIYVHISSFCFLMSDFCFLYIYIAIAGPWKACQIISTCCMKMQLKSTRNWIQIAEKTNNPCVMSTNFFPTVSVEVAWFSSVPLSFFSSSSLLPRLYKCSTTDRSYRRRRPPDVRSPHPCYGLVQMQYNRPLL